MSNYLAIGGIAALLAILVLFVGVVAKWATRASTPAADAPPSPPPASATPGQQSPSPMPATPSPSTPTGDPRGAPAAPFATDDRGFIDSNARCEGTQTAFAIGRTDGSLVVICADRNGQYEYLGVRLSDDAVLRTVAETTPARGFVARNAGVSYQVSPTELVVTAGDTVIKHEPMIEYREANAHTADAAPG